MEKKRIYSTLNYPHAAPGSKTLLTGIRSVQNCKYCPKGKRPSGKVYISGFYETADSTVSFMYKGCLNGRGAWHNLGYPSRPGATVVSTSLYGPNNGDRCGTIQVVGNYLTEELGTFAQGCLYEGPLDGSGKWTTLKPTATEPVLNTIAHSTMGGLVVGNFDTQLNEGRAFIYDIKRKKYHEIKKENAKTITAYGIWHNSGHSYTICGGFSELDAQSNIGASYIVDWDNRRRELSNWSVYHYNNDPIKSLVTHFDGITGNECGDGYNLTGDWLGFGQTEEFGFYATVRREKNGKLSKARWSPISYPNQSATSGNSVDKSTVIGVYTSEGDDMINGYVSQEIHS